MWKKFDFFTSTLLQSDLPTSSLYSVQALDITSVTSGNGQLFFADSEGGITISKQNYEVTRVLAHDGCINHAYYHKISHILLTIASDEDLREENDVSHSQETCKRVRQSLYANPTYEPMMKSMGLDPIVSPLQSSISTELKIWNVTNGKIECIKTFSLFPSTAPEYVSSLCVDEENELLVAGTSSGKVYAVRGDLLRMKRCKLTLLASSLQTPVTNVHILPSEDRSQIYVYATTAAQTHCITLPLAASLSVEAVTLVHPDRGALPGCSTVSDRGELLVGSEDGITRFSGVENVGNYAFAGTKQAVRSFKDCLLVCTAEDEEQVITIYNVQGHFIEYRGYLKRGNAVEWVQDVFSEWGDLFILTRSHSVFCLHRLDLQSKLAVFYEQNLYHLALTVAHSNDLYYSAIVEIHRRYGDFLYDKQEFDEAVAEYIKTIGFIEPSYVIKRFLDWPRLPNLTSYLECLHAQGKATSEHTTLLLKCYSRMHMQDKLRAFVSNEGSAMQFDVATAIRVLRDCGAIDEAKELARRSQSHSAYLQILLQDTREFDDALAYLQTLPFASVDSLVQTHGRLLLEHAGDRTTDLLVRLCTGYTPSCSSSTFLPSSSSSASLPSSPLPSSSPPKPSLRECVRDSILSHAQRLDCAQVSSAAPALLATLGEKALEPVYANPSTYIHLFTSHTPLLRRFLTQVTARDQECDCLTWNTLIELLVREESERRASGAVGNGDGDGDGDVDESKSKSKSEGEGESEGESEVMRVLRDPRANYDNEEALVLVQSYDHLEGELFLYERNKMYSFLLQQFLRNKDSQAAIELCKRHGEMQNALWIQLIMIIAKQEPVDEVFLEEILDYIERTDVLPLLYVLQVLCENGHIQLKMVQKYIVRLMQKLKGMLAIDNEHIAEITANNQYLRREINTLRRGAHLFQASRCRVCNLPLELPVVHFVCGHSYHKACLGGHEGCIQCAFKLKPYLKETEAPTAEEFFDALQMNRDGFGVTAEFFGKRIFSSLEKAPEEKEKEVMIE